MANNGMSGCGITVSLSEWQLVVTERNEAQRKLARATDVDALLSALQPRLDESDAGFVVETVQALAGGSR